MITNDRQNHTPNSACIIIYTLQQTGYFAYIISLYAIFAEVRTSNKGNKKILKIIESNKFKNMSFSNVVETLPFFKKEKGEEKKDFDKFFERKFEGVDKGSENGVEFDKVKVWCINKNDTEKNNFKFLLDLKISSFSRNDNINNGMLIYCHKGDGISWLSEKTLKMSNTIIKEYGYDIKTDIITKNKSEFPISKLIGRKRQLLKSAVREEFIESFRSSFISNVVIFLVTMASVVTIIPDFYSVLEQIGINVTTSQWRLIIGFVIIATIAYNLYDLREKLRNTKKKERKDFLEKLENKDKNYQSFIDNVADKIDNFDNKKIVVIDDIASIDEYGFSHDILLRHIEKNKDKKNKKIFWIIYSSDLSVAREIINKSSATFFELRLCLLDINEKKKLCADLNYDNNNSSFVTIKEICTGKVDKGAELSIQNELLKFKETNPTLFNFLYLLILNNFPQDSKYKIKQLIEKISPRKDEREKDAYIKKFFESVPTTDDIENYFGNDRIKKYYEYDKDSEKFSIHNNISRLIENNPDLFDYHNYYRYGQGYWALTWYYANRGKDEDKKIPKVHFVQKISHHLQNADSCGIENVEVRASLLDAHLFTARCSLSYLQKNDVERILNHVFKLNIQGIENIQKDKTARLILEAFKNFNYFPDNKPRFEDLECEELYKFLNTKEISLAYSLLQNKEYSSVSGYIISFLLEQYWERIFFLWIFNKAKLSYNLMTKISTELTELSTYFVNYFNMRKDISPLYLSNLALDTWINYIRLLRDDESIQIEQIIQNIDSFLSYYNKASADISKDDVYQQTNIQESICLVVSITLLLLKRQDTNERQKLENVLQFFKPIFNEVELDIKNYDKSIDDIMRFLLLHSLMWKNCNFNVRYSMLSIIRVQLFLFSNNSKEVVVKDVVKAKEILRITIGQINNKNRLTTLLCFSLYSLNRDLIKTDERKSSFLFQRALDFTNKNDISDIQFEYLYFCVEKCWYHDSEKLKEILKCLVKCSDNFFDKIVEKTCEYPDSYLHICNCLNSFNNNELSLLIDNTEYTYVSFFDKILEQARLKEQVELENAECIWKNYKFQKFSAQEKQVKKQKFEDWWRENNREENILFGDALTMLFTLDKNNVQENIMRKAYNFLANNDTEILLSYSFNLIVACHFCEEKKNKKTLDEEYNNILEFITSYEGFWEKSYGNLYGNSIFLYKTLYNHTKHIEYNEKYKLYKLLETQEKIENFEITDYIGFFYSLWKIFENDLNVCNDISPTEKQLLKNRNIKGFLESINYDTICAIYDNGISEKYLTLCFLTKTKSAREKLNELAKKNINNNSLIKLIMDTYGNRKYIERIQQLRDELNKPVRSYDDEE